MPTERKELERLYREEGPCVWGYLRRRIADSHDAEEMFQQVYMIVANQPVRLESASSPRAWLLGIARNLLLEYLRRKKRPRCEPLSQDLASPRVDDADERLSAMQKAIMRLPELQREVLELRLMEELSYNAIARVLEVPVGTIRSRIHNAVQALREALTDGMKLPKQNAPRVRR
jgi:RNA polymerase sigma-70 factor (ECF subfamily)